MSAYGKLFPHVKSLWNPSKYGFFSTRSTATNLTHFTQFALESLDNHKQVNTIYTDFSKIIDRLDQTFLMHKLKNIYYLSDRYQNVELNGYKSYLFKSTREANLHHFYSLSLLMILRNASQVIPFSWLMIQKCKGEVRSIDDCYQLQSDNDALNHK